MMLVAALRDYEATILSMGVLALLLVVQVVVADMIGIRSRHLPGTPIDADHANPLFRVSRTVANTNESIAAYIILVLFCIFSGADADATGYLSWGFVLARAGYAVCYYANLQIARSVLFGISMVMLAGMLVTGFFT